MTTLERLAKVFNEIFAVPKETVTEQTVPDDVPKWDSLGHMTMVAALEIEFDLTFEVDEIMEMATVISILDILNKKVING